MHLAMASRKEMKLFLASAQYSAFKHAQLALTDQTQAIHSVHAAMHTLARCHSHASPTELPLLFQRILLARLRQQLRHLRWQRCLPNLLAALIPRREEDASPDPLEMLQIQPRSSSESLEHWLQTPEHTLLVDAALRLLPLRQREAFLLSHWGQLDVEQIARVLACPIRRVRRDISRAQHTLELIFAQKESAQAARTAMPDLPTVEDCIRLTLQYAAQQQDPAVCQQLEQAASAALNQHQAEAPCRWTERWRRWSMLHQLALQRMVGLLVLAGLGLTLLLQIPVPERDTGASDIHLLASELPLETLLDRHFEEATHE